MFNLHSTHYSSKPFLKPETRLLKTLSPSLSPSDNSNGRVIYYVLLSHAQSAEISWYSEEDHLTGKLCDLSEMIFHNELKKQKKVEFTTTLFARRSREKKSKMLLAFHHYFQRMHFFLYLLSVDTLWILLHLWNDDLKVHSFLE